MRNNPNPVNPFPKGRKSNAGRKPGVPNKFTRELKEALLRAAEDVGEVREQDILDADGKPTGRTRLVPTGKDGLIGYLRWAAVHRSNAFIAQLGRVLPLQVNAKSEHQGQSEVRDG